MLPFAHKVAFLLFAAVTVAIGLRGFYRVYRRIRVGSDDSDLRFDDLPRRFWYALTTTLTQSRTFRRRPVIGFFHSFIFYGFVFYILVNLKPWSRGFVPFYPFDHLTLWASFTTCWPICSARSCSSE